MKGIKIMIILVKDKNDRETLLNTDKIVRAVGIYPTKIEDPFQIIARLDRSDEVIEFSKIAYTYHDQSLEFKQIKSLTDFYLYLSEMQNQN
jgi:hypothetical protein